MTSDYSPTSVAIPILASNRPWSFQHSPPKALARMARAMAANAGAVLGPDGEEEAEAEAGQ